MYYSGRCKYENSHDGECTLKGAAEYPKDAGCTASMKITKIELAKILSQLPKTAISKIRPWQELSFHQKLSCITEAERFIKVIKIAKGEING